MKLLDDLYNITECSTTGSGFTARIKLFANHIIYSGHFPGHPITPGVIQLQLVHELMENHFGKNLKLLGIDDCKFLKILNPLEQDEIQITVEYVVNGSLLHVKAMGQHDTDKYFKLGASYQHIQGS